MVSILLKTLTSAAFSTLKNPKIIGKIIQAFRQINHPFLMDIQKVQNIQQGATVLTYQYIDTPINHYIRSFLHDSIQLKLQKLYIQLRNLASKLVLKNISILNAISYKNIGVRIQDIYRQSFTASVSNLNRKQLTLPDFKIYLHIDKCEIIQNMHEMGKVLIQADKLICNTISAQISGIVAEAQKQKQALTLKRKLGTFKSLIFTDCEDSQQNKITKNGASRIYQRQFLVFKANDQQQPQNLEFTNKIKRRKREKKDDKIEKKSPTHLRANTERKMEKKQTEEEDTLSYQQQIKSIKSFLSNNVSDLDKQQLNIQIQHILKKSKKTLNTFKLLVNQYKQK